VPVISYLVLRGRCAGCKAPISPRYPCVELLTGCLSALVAWNFGFTWTTAAGLLFVWAMIALAFIDLDSFYLPDDITLPLLWAGILVNMGGAFVDLQTSVIGAVAGYLSLWLVYWGFKFATGKEGMGYGDFKLLAAIGAWLGWKMLPVVIMLSSLVGAVIGIGLIALAQHERSKPIPFGPYLVLGGLIALFRGEAIVKYYLQNL
jgi:leader peptidase (prepilin peptidase)/N-methyltransferase